MQGPNNLVKPISTSKPILQPSPTTSISGKKPGCEQYQMNLSDVKIPVNKLKMDNPSQQIKVISKLLQCVSYLYH